MDYSWIPIVRNIRQMDWFYGRSNLVHLWLEILFRASREPCTYPVGKEIIKLKPGQFVCSMRKLSNFLNISRNTLSDLIFILEKQGWIKKESVGNLTLFTVIKVDQMPFSQNYQSENSFSEYIKSSYTYNEDEIALSANTEAINRAKVEAINIYNKNKINNTEKSSIYKREENLNFFKDIREDISFWDELSILLEIDLKTVKEKSEKFFHECLIKKDYKETVLEVKNHLINWLKKSHSNEKNNFNPNTKTFIEHGKNTNNNRRGTEADTPRYRDGAEPKF